MPDLRSSSLMRRRLPLAAALLPLFLALSAPLAAQAETVRQSPSEFVRAHAGTAVQWMPWGEAAWARAAQENRPIFLTVGAMPSELSAAMRRQTFSNADIAAFLNENFVCVVVDRDELPALAAQGQAYVRAVKQLSGWPLNLWLTPELLPFDGATYLPPSEEWGKEGFLNAAQRVAAAWRNDPEGAREDAAQAVRTIAEYETPLPLEAFRVSELRTSLQGSAAAWAEQSDASHGGFGESPRHPEPEMLRYLLRSEQPARQIALANVRGMLASGLRDPLDGGFFRYTTDADGLLPYFQKRLNDQARLVLALLDARDASDDALFAHAATQTLDYVLTELARADGAFFAGQDATAPRASAYYAWTHDDLVQMLGAKPAATVATALGARRDGNVSRDNDPSHAFLGQNLLAGAPDPSLDEALAKLRTARARRPAPTKDETVVAGDQGLILLALARGGRELGQPRFTAAAERSAAFITKTFVQPAGTLRRLAGSEAPAAPEDYSAVAMGLRALGRAEEQAVANRLLVQHDQQFFDAKSGVLYLTGPDLARGHWLRLPAPASTPGESPSAAPLRLLAGEPFHDALPALLATQHRDPSLTAAGDILLALRVHLDRLP